MPLTRLLGKQLLSKSNGALVSTTEALKGASAIGIYFSAGWCPPCRGFTPVFVDSYLKHLEPKGLRCVLVSWDRDEASFTDYFSQMPWLALPYGDSARNKELGQLFNVKSIPTLALVDMEGRTITTEARNAVVEDPTGEGFPWRPPLVRDLAHGHPGRINELPSLVYLCETTGPGEQAKALEELTAVATDDSTLACFLGSGGPLSAQVRQLCGLPVQGAPQLIFLDIPNGASFYVGPECAEVPSRAAVVQFLADIQAGKVARQQLAPPS
eukprot:TRINITY_DN85725_c0_g1_i1.p1 TRINITY_DN85725_c0_g1~~TRINITY_DN85725_c0_g1_i1.p1  ORF type:complete len:282 (+),score=44.39 TRINITY_DN85725_c0_g1_i1:41-847(+)